MAASSSHSGQSLEDVTKELSQFAQWVLEEQSPCNTASPATVKIAGLELVAASPMVKTLRVEVVQQRRNEKRQSDLQMLNLNEPRYSGKTENK